MEKTGSVNPSADMLLQPIAGALSALSVLQELNAMSMIKYFGTGLPVHPH